MRHKIVLINGAPGVGKDTLANGMATLMKECRQDNVVVDKFAAPLKSAVHALFGMPRVPLDIFESRKNEPCPELFGAIPRKEYIALSEEYVKLRFDNEHFGRVMVQRIKQSAREHKLNVTIISDSGFASEAQPVIREFGADNVMLINIKREGCDFSGDSRSDLTIPEVENLWLVNDGKVSDLINTGTLRVLAWLSKQSNNSNTNSKNAQESSS